MNSQVSLLDQLDITASRHGGSETSIAAHDRIKESKEADRNRIMALVQARKDYGITVHEASAALGYGHAINRCSGRLSELVQRGKLKKSGERRNHAAVLVEV
jgi:hypothetical protein